MEKATTNNLSNNASFLYRPDGLAVRAFSRRALPAQVIADLVKSVARTDQIVSLADRLMRLAESALDLHQTAVVEQVSQALFELPLPRRYESFAEYYRVFALRRRGAEAQACAGFERLAETPTLPLAFRARALQAIGASLATEGRWDNVSYYYLHACRVATAGGDLFTQLNARWLMAMDFKSRNGDHAGALNDFETMLPLIRVLAVERPEVYSRYLNSCAVELGELGRYDEALRLADLAVRTPYAKIFPQYHETRAEILEKMHRASPFVIGGVRWPQEPVAAPEAAEAVTPPVSATAPVAVSNVIAVPFAARSAQSPRNDSPQQPARVIAYSGWQQPAADAADISAESFTPAELRQMSIPAKQKALLTAIFHDDVTHDTLDRLLACAGKIIPDQTVG